MRRAVFLLCLLSCLLTSFQARANPANCDGDMTPDQTEMLEYVVGLHPILFGGPVAIMRTCEQVKKFLSVLSNLGVSKRTQSVSDEQVRGALEGTRAGPGSASSCLLKFDAAACKRYFGFSDSAPTVTETSTAPAQPAMTLARAKIKRDELLLKDRELANNLVPLCKSITSEQACVSRLLAIENLRDDVARWNKDPELMAFIPPITIDSPDLIAQTGWERGVGGGGWTNRAGNKAEREVCPELTKLINSLVANAPERARERIPEFRSTCAERDPSYATWLPRWESQLAGASAKGGTKGGAYVRPEDCERLSRQIDADLRARPRVEPPSLSFFEVECVGDASGKYAGQVVSWKQALANRKATEALNQWDGGVRQAEAEQRKAREEEERRVAVQKSAEEERQRVAAQRKRAEDEAAAPSHLDHSGRSSCVAELRDEYIDARARSARQSNGKPYATNREGVVRYLDALIGGAAQWKNNGDLKNARADVEKQLKEDLLIRQRVSGGDLDMVNGRIAEHKMHLCLYNSLLDDAGVTSNKVAKSGSPSGSRMSTQECEARKQQVISTKIPPNASITASQETVMFMTKTVLDMIAGGCPTEPGVTPAQIEAERKLRQQQYTAAENACNAVQSGGRRCVPQAHAAAGAVSKPVAALAAPSAQQKRVLSYDPVTGSCSGSREECACIPGIGTERFGDCPSSRSSSGGGIRTAR